MKTVSLKWWYGPFPFFEKKIIRQGVFFCLYFLFVIAGMTIARRTDDNSFSDLLILTLCYIMLMTSPVTLGKAGTIFSFVVFFASFLGMHRVVWKLKDQHFMMVYTFNVASLISLLVIDALYRKLNLRAKYYQAESMTDGLTGLFNRRYFEQQLDREFKKSQREGYSLCLIIVDVDNFKDINDNMGHDAGDQVLQGIGEILRKNVRATDIPCRIGGDEFALILSDCRKSVVERVVSCIQNDLALLEDKLSLAGEVTVSVGGAISSDKISEVRDLFKKADESLYMVKENGRNGSLIGDESVDPDIQAELGEVLQEIYS